MGLTNQIRNAALVALLAATTMLVACGKKGGGNTTNPDANPGAASGAVANIPSPQTCFEQTLPQTSPSYPIYRRAGLRPARWTQHRTYVYAWVGINLPGMNNSLTVYGGYGYPTGPRYPTYYDVYPNGSPYGYTNGYTYYHDNYHGNHGRIRRGRDRLPRLPGGFCGGRTGTITVCDSTGLAQVSEQDLRNMSQYQIALYNYNGTNISFDNYYGYNGDRWSWNHNTVSSSCRVAQSCIVGTATCGFGVCRPIRHGSNIGLCTR